MMLLSLCRVRTWSLALSAIVLADPASTVAVSGIARYLMSTPAHRPTCISDRIRHRPHGISTGADPMVMADSQQRPDGERTAVTQPHESDPYALSDLRTTCPLAARK